MMKVAYLMKHEADLKTVVPPDFDYVRISSNPKGLWETEQLALLQDVEALLVWTEPVTRDVIEAVPKLKIVQRLGAGYDVLLGCFEAARMRGIPCCNLQGVNKEAVGEHCMLLILAVTRRLLEMHEQAGRAGWPRWLSPENPVFELVGKTLGIIGLGNTGFERAKRAKGFDMPIVYNDTREIDPELVRSLGATCLEKEDLYRESDVISINTDLNPTSRNMITAHALSLMKPTAVLICCARGGIIDQQALCNALDSDRLYGAGIDVYEPEPILPENPLLSAKNIVLTPHVAAVTGETLKRHYDAAHENVRDVLKYGRKPRWVLNGV